MIDVTYYLFVKTSEFTDNTFKFILESKKKSLDILNPYIYNYSISIFKNR